MCPKFSHLLKTYSPECGIFLIRFTKMTFLSVSYYADEFQFFRSNTAEILSNIQILKLNMVDGESCNSKLKTLLKYICISQNIQIFVEHCLRKISGKLRCYTERWKRYRRTSCLSLVSARLIFFLSWFLGDFGSWESTQTLPVSTRISGPGNP